MLVIMGKTFKLVAADAILDRQKSFGVWSEQSSEEGGGREENAYGQPDRKISVFLTTSLREV